MTDQKPEINIKQQNPVSRPVVPVNNVASAARPVLRPIAMKPSPATIPAQKGQNMKKGPLFIIGLIVVLLGAGSGYVFAAMRNGGGGVSGLKNEAGLQREVTSSEITVGTKVGVADESTYKDSTEGTLEKGGIDGEGSHHLTRPGGESQTVYITSSIIDLDQFVGRKVKIWGETVSSQKAGWFMDVGKLEVLE